jgi:hypothetical protein
MMEPHPHNPVTELQAAPQPGQLWQKPAANDWQVLSETFETMGKVGLAMTVGFAAAGMFCKLVDSGHVKLPSVASLVMPPVEPQ